MEIRIKFSHESEIRTPIYFSFTILGYILKESKFAYGSDSSTHTHMFIAVSFTIAKTKNSFKCLSG